MIHLFECFAGYGTTTFALKQLGIEHELVGFSEIDKYAVQCFQQNHGGKNFGDITKIDWSQVPDFDLLTGGFPCQAFSTAGKQLGEQDHRGQLGLELTRALIAKQPKYFLFENVKGFMSKKFAETREKFVKSWEDAGYKVQYKVLNTKDFGVPQNRERVWFVGIRKDIQQDFIYPEPFELKIKLKDILEEQVDEKYFASEKLLEGLKKSNYHERQPMSIDKEYSNIIKVGGDVRSIVMTTLTQATGNRAGSSKEYLEHCNRVAQSCGQVRRLTPKECFRLQGFLNDQINLEGLSDTQKYKLAGNGQSVNVVKLLLKQLVLNIS